MLVTISFTSVADYLSSLSCVQFQVVWTARLSHNAMEFILRLAVPVRSRAREFQGRWSDLMGLMVFPMRRY